MNRFISILFLILYSLYAHAYSHTIDVNIYSGSNIRELTLSVVSGKYEIYSDGNLKSTFNTGESVNISIIDNKLNVKYDSSCISGTKVLKIISKSDDGVLKVNPSGKHRIKNYDDNLTLTIENGVIRIINNINIEKYVSGVVEAEVGNLKSIELYKVQAITCRTYVLKNIRRHIHEGFNVCDKVDCQVYNGKCYNENILKAIEQTRYYVIIDKNLNFISAVFHSNCGGQTINSEHVWSLSSTYLKSIKDTFCLKSKNAVWEFKINKENFLNYLKKTYNFPIDDSVMVQKALSFSQVNGRKVYFLDMPNIHLKNIRNDLGLKSTFFTIYQNNDVLTFKGKGFGHGVGLCQEGAMQMILKGYSYENIIKHYFTNVYIVNYEDIIELNK